MDRIAIVFLLLVACSEEPDPVVAGWQRISDVNGPIIAPGVDRLWFSACCHFKRELPDRTYVGTYEEDDFASTVDLHAGADSWSGWADQPLCPPPRETQHCLVLYDGKDTRDTYRALAPIGRGEWF